jgi:dTDP-4-dehydrorhamnose reductase
VEAAFSSDQELNVVCDQFGQPTFAKDLANQIINAVEKNIPFGIYHATNSGESSWFEFAQEIFELLGANKSRLNAVSSDFYDLPAIRPRYSVLGHNAWKDTVVKPMRNWKIALEEAIPTLIGAKSPVQPKKLRRIKY